MNTFRTFQLIKIASALFVVPGLAAVWFLWLVSNYASKELVGWELVLLFVAASSMLLLISYFCFITPWLLWTRRLQRGLEGVAVQGAFASMGLLSAIHDRTLGDNYTWLRVIYFLVGVAVFHWLNGTLRKVFGIQAGTCQKA